MPTSRRSPLGALLVIAAVVLLIALGVGIFFSPSLRAFLHLPWPASAHAVPLKASQGSVSPAHIAHAPAPPQGPSAPVAAAPPKAAKVTPSRTPIALGPCQPGDTGKPFQWKHSGGNPYAHSEAEAFSDAKLDRMLACNSIPRADWVAIKQQLRNASNGESIALDPGYALPTMMFGNGQMIRNVVVQIAGGQRALQFRVLANGHEYVFVLPLGCWNWSRGVQRARLVPLKLDCVTLSFNGYVGGKVKWGVGSVTGPFPPSLCNAQKEGNGPWVAWHGQCDFCTPALGYIRSILGRTAEVYHRYVYPVAARHQTLRFDRSVIDKVVYVCLEDPEGTSSCGVYMRPQDWKGRSHADLPDALWRADEGDCP